MVTTDMTATECSVLLPRPDLPCIGGAVLFRMWTDNDVPILNVDNVLHEEIENKDDLLNSFEFLVEDDATIGSDINIQ